MNIYHGDWDTFNKKMSELFGIDYVPSDYTPPKFKTINNNYDSTGFLHSAEVRKSISDYITELWKDPDSLYNTEEFRKKRSEYVSKAWANPDAKYNTPEHRQKIREWNEKAYNNVNSGIHKRRKSYIVTFPDGVDRVILGLRKFCRDSGLDYRAIKYVLAGKQSHHKGYKIRRSESA